MKSGAKFTDNGANYEYVREGCASNWEKCSREKPITAIPLNRKGERCFGDVTVCLEGKDHD